MFNPDKILKTERKITDSKMDLERKIKFLLSKKVNDFMKIEHISQGT